MWISTIPKVKELKLISIYLYICDIYISSLKNLSQRFSNNDQLEFTIKSTFTLFQTFYIWYHVVCQVIADSAADKKVKIKNKTWFSYILSFDDTFKNYFFRCRCITQLIDPYLIQSIKSS